MKRVDAWASVGEEVNEDVGLPYDRVFAQTSRQLQRARNAQLALSCLQELVKSVTFVENGFGEGKTVV